MVDDGMPVASVAANETFAPHTPGVLFTVISAGTTITGAKPATVTSKLVCVLLPLASVAITVTVVVPIAKVDPLDGTAVTDTLLLQLSVAFGMTYITVAPFALVALTTPATFGVRIEAVVVNCGGVVSEIVTLIALDASDEQPLFAITTL